MSKDHLAVPLAGWFSQDIGDLPRANEGMGQRELPAKAEQPPPPGLSSSDGIHLEGRLDLGQSRSDRQSR
jgi:hypothetical protein